MKCPADRGHAGAASGLRNERATATVFSNGGLERSIKEADMAARFLTAVAAALLLISPDLWAQSQPADPPGRVGRVSAIEGSVQQRTPDDNDWTAASLNYPVSTGFAIAPQDGGRAELQVGSMALRVGSASELDVTNLGDRDASLT